LPLTVWQPSDVLKEMKHKKELKFLIDRSNKIYKDYYSKKPIFLYAKQLKVCNKKIIDFLYTKGYLFDDIESINILLNHFEIWLFQFNEFETKKTKLNEKFVFQKIKESIPYPKNEINKLLL